MSALTLDAVLSHLDGVKKSGDGYEALCPAHDDHDPSLTITAGKNGKAVLFCHAGCGYDAIIAAAGFDRPDTRQQSKQSAGRKIVATYDYRDEQGVLLYQKVRYHHKDFRIRRPNGDGWTWSKGDARSVLYRLPELLQAKAAGATIFFPEGEKDADRLHQAGLTATTNFEGAANEGQRAKWRQEYSDQLAGAARVILLPDNDDPGRAHVAAIAQALTGRVADVRVLELAGLPEKGDVSNWLDSGRTTDELLLVESTPPFDHANKGDLRQQLGIKSLAEIIRTVYPKAKWAIPGILPEGLTLLAGPPKVKKSWFSLGVSIAVSTGGKALGKIDVEKGRVLYLALEDRERRLQKRGKAILSDGHAGPELLDLVTGWKRLDDGGLEALRLYLTQYKNTRLIIVDTLAKVRGRKLPGLSDYDADYLAISALKRIADEYAICILLLQYFGHFLGFSRLQKFKLLIYK